MNEETKVVDNIIDFKSASIEKIVTKLIEKGIISASEKAAVIKLYESDDRDLYKIIDESNNIQRSIITPRIIDLVAKALKQKGTLISDDEVKKFNDIYQNDNRKYNEIIRELATISREDLLIKLNIKKEEEEKKQPENKISIENIKEFRKENGKKYISIHSNYPNEEVKVIENRTDKSAIEMFEMYKNNTELPTVDGFVSSCDVFKNSIEPDRTEVKIYNITALAKVGEYDKLSSVQKEVVKGTLMSIINELAGISEEEKRKLKDLEVSELVKMLNKDVYLSPDENVVLLCVPNDATQDQPMEVVGDTKGNYRLVSLNASGYEYASNSESVGETTDNKEIEEESKEIGITPEEKGRVLTIKPNKPKDSIIEERAA